MSETVREFVESITRLGGKIFGEKDDIIMIEFPNLESAEQWASARQDAVVLLVSEIPTQYEGRPFVAYFK